MSNRHPDDRIQHGAEHLHRLGFRATAEFLSEMIRRIGGRSSVIDLLEDYQRSLTPEMVRAAGADRFPSFAPRLVASDARP